MRRRVDEGGVAVVVGVLHQLYLVVKVVMLAAVYVDGSFELYLTVFCTKFNFASILCL